MLSSSNSVKIEPRKYFNFVLNSTNSSASGTYNNTLYFNIDWTYIPQGKYKVRFTFQSSDQIQNFAYVPCIYLDLGQGANTVIESATGTVTQRADYLGALSFGPIFYNSGTSSSYVMLSADMNSNPPIYLASRPNNNTVILSFLASDGTRLNTTYVAPFVLNLHFELLDEK